MKCNSLVLIILLLLPTAALAAPAVVIKSTAEGFAVGMMVETIDVPNGASVTLVAPDGTTVTREGPYRGPAAGGSARDESAVRKIARFLREREGETRVGAVRAAGNRLPNDPGVIPVSASGRYCVDPGAASLWRPDTATDGTYTLRILGGARADVGFAAGVAGVPWPPGVPLRDGSTYLVRPSRGAGSSRLVISVAHGVLENAAVRLAWMIDQGCAKQASLLLDRLADD